MADYNYTARVELGPGAQEADAKIHLDDAQVVVRVWRDADRDHDTMRVTVVPDNGPVRLVYLGPVSEAGK